MKHAELPINPNFFINLFKRGEFLSGIFSHWLKIKTELTTSVDEINSTFISK